MKDLIFITAYCPTEEQEKMLERCVNSVLKYEKHVALISHTHIPIHIQKKCHYYVYDYNNEISDDYNLLGHNHFQFGNQRIQSRFFNKYFYGFAIYRMFSIASQIAINFGYDNIHYIEYDCELLDEELINENSNFLKEYDSVIHTSNGKEDGFLFGSFKSFRVSSLPEKFKNYDKDFIQEEMKITEPTHLEFLSKKLFINSGKVLFQNEPSEDKFKRGGREHHRNLHFTLFYNPKDKNLNIFYNSVIDLVEEITIIINKKNMVQITTKPHHWHIKSLGNFNEITHVRVDNNKKVIYEIAFDDNFRETFKIKSYITEN
jgi:hypothetical protein